MKQYVQSFVVGSSILSYMLFILSLMRLPRDYYNFNPYVYYIIIPFYFGLMNMFSLFLTNKFNLSKLVRLVLISMMSSSVVIFLVYNFKLYNWKKSNKKYRYPFMNFMGHLFCYFIMIYVLETLIN